MRLKNWKEDVDGFLFAVEEESSDAFIAEALAETASNSVNHEHLKSPSVCQPA